MSVAAAVTESYATWMVDTRQIRAARALLGWTQTELAAKAGLSIATLNNIERGVADPRASTLRAIETALIVGGVIFIERSNPSMAGGPGVRLAD